MDAAAKALRESGFSYQRIHRHVEIATELEGQIDEVDASPLRPKLSRSGAPILRGWPRVTLDDYDSTQRAVSFYKTVKSPRPALRYRICNVTLWSDDAHPDSAAAARMHRAAHVLREMC